MPRTDYLVGNLTDRQAARVARLVCSWPGWCVYDQPKRDSKRPRWGETSPPNIGTGFAKLPPPHPILAGRARKAPQKGPSQPQRGSVARGTGVITSLSPSPNSTPVDSSLDALGDRLTALRRHFNDSPYRALRLVECRYMGQQITLGGRVPTYYLKQLAQAIALRLLGSQGLINQIEVNWP